MLPSNSNDCIEIILEISSRNHWKKLLLKFEMKKVSTSISRKIAWINESIATSRKQRKWIKNVYKQSLPGKFGLEPGPSHIDSLEKITNLYATCGEAKNKFKKFRMIIMIIL